MSIITTEKLSYHINSKTILDNISFSVDQGEFIGILGPNGCGKTTLLRCLIRALDHFDGRINVFDKCIKRYSRKDLARAISYVPQISEPPAGFSVEEVIYMGRSPYNDNKNSKKDTEAVNNAMGQLNLIQRKNDDISKLSGGEYQRVLIARALAQEGKIILLDEVTAHLDIKYQIDILNTLKNIGEKTIIATFHDIFLARKYFYIYLKLQ